MSEIRRENARIAKTFLGFEDHGILTALIELEGGGWRQGFGGYVLKGPACALFVERVLAVVGVSAWEKLVGQYVRVDYTDEKVHAIFHLIEDRWFNPSIELRDLEQAQRG